MNTPKRFKTHEEYLQWYRDYRVQNREKFRAYNRKYNKEWRHKFGYASEMRSRLKYPEKEKARRELQYAVKKGLIKREPCEVCDDLRSQAHHEDYTKPLQVKWLCAIHHRQADDQLRLRKQGLKKLLTDKILKLLQF